MRRKSGGFGGAGSSRNSSTASLTGLLAGHAGREAGSKSDIGLAESGELTRPSLSDNGSSHSETMDTQRYHEAPYGSPFPSRPPSTIPSRAPSPTPRGLSFGRRISTGSEKIGANGLPS